MIALTVTGFADLEQALDASFSALQSEVIRILSAGAGDIAGDAKTRVRQQRAPDLPEQSPLADSIHVLSHNKGADVVTEITYAKFVEFGTSRAPAEPFLHPAFEQNLGDIQLALQALNPALNPHRGDENG